MYYTCWYDILPVYVEYDWYLLSLCMLSIFGTYSLCMLSMFGILYYYYWMLSCMGPVQYVWYVRDQINANHTDLEMKKLQTAFYIHVVDPDWDPC